MGPGNSRHRRVLTTLGLLAALALPATAVAAPPEKIIESYTVMFPNTDARVVVLINTTREEFCTPEMVAWEEAVIAFNAWFDGGQTGPAPVVPDITFPDGTEPIRSTLITTRQGALVRHVEGRDLVGEVWRLIDDAPLVGPCTDTEPDGLLFAGSATISGNDNDLFASGTRGNSYGDSGSIRGKDPDGRRHSYTWRFHVNDRCYAPDGDAPRCVVDTWELR